MTRNATLALIAAGMILPLAAQAQLQRPGHIPLPGQPGHHDLPTPHPRPLPVTYYLTCTLGDSVIGTGPVWHVHNAGRNTVPAGTWFGVQYGYALQDSYPMRSALAPGDTQDYAAVHRGIPSTKEAQCEANVLRNPD